MILIISSPLSFERAEGRTLASDEHEEKDVERDGKADGRPISAISETGLS